MYNNLFYWFEYACYECCALFFDEIKIIILIALGHCFRQRNYEKTSSDGVGQKIFENRYHIFDVGSSTTAGSFKEPVPKALYPAFSPES